MGIAYRCEPDTGIVIVVWDGEISVDEARDHLTTISADPLVATARVFVTDATSVSVVSLPTFEKVVEMGEAFLELLAPRVTRAKWAVVADSVFDDVRKLEAHIALDAHRMVVFTNLPTACVWLNLDSRAVQTVVNELRRELRDAG